MSHILESWSDLPWWERAGLSQEQGEVLDWLGVQYNKAGLPFDPIAMAYVLQGPCNVKNLGIDLQKTLEMVRPRHLWYPNCVKK